VDETTPLDPTTEKTEVLAEAERIATEVAGDHGIDGTVARFAGLYGPDRYRLERYLEGPVTEGYLNMVHRDDAAGVVRYLLETDRARDDVVLVVDDEPAPKWEFADWLAAECGVPEPPKRTKAERLADDSLSAAARRRIETSKRCSNDRLREWGYDFSFPTYREGYRTAIEAYRSGNYG
jgi:nucleoside-diphosphate-sugar epimerase